MGCLAKLLYALLSATSITDASSTTSSTAPPRGCSRHARENKFMAFQTQTRHQVDSLALDSFHRAPALRPAPCTRKRVLDIQNPIASQRYVTAIVTNGLACSRTVGRPRVAPRLQRFVFGFLVIHRFYQLPTSA
ncbi:hypothetical protein T492DRAFT_929990 [Pavlovales sp. CCMP2436]|nr:hypothetical protein T492DRAFT_929990 [Pavlovales sp. CCMP2436]